MTTPALSRRRALLARNRARRGARIPPRAEPPTAIALTYARALRSIVRLFGMQSRALIEGVAPHLRERADADGDPPAFPRQVVDRVVAQLRARLAARVDTPAIRRRVEAIAMRAAGWSERELRRQLRQLTGIDPTLEDPDLSRLMERFREQNLKLIRSLADDQVARVRRVLTRARIGTRVEELTADIREQTGAVASRAELIARDQTLKLNAQVTRARHEALGVTHFRWSTSRDARVRASHRELDGREFAYADPPIVDGEPTIPGVGFQCRCLAIPIVSGDEAASS